MKAKSRKLGWIFTLWRLFFTVAIFTAFSPSWVLAQSTDDPWVDPINLSRSGIAMNPAFVIDSENLGHVVWQDNLGEYLYSRLDGSQWSEPQATELDLLFRLPPDVAASPIYRGSNPLFIAGPGQYVFAFWISTQGRLFTSKVENQDFQDVGAWDSGRIVAPEAASFAAAVDARGEWHVAFLRTVGDTENPAGIYYTRSKSNGQNWAVPVLLYESPYIRRLVEGEANLSVSTIEKGDALHVFIAWDHRPRKQVLLARSTDGGGTWGEPTVIAGPEQDSGPAGPFNIHVGTHQGSVLLIWQSGRPGGTCGQVYQFSRDSGASWSDPQPMIEDLLGCAQSNKFVTELAIHPDGPLYLLTEIQGQMFLSAWNGFQWSQPQLQPMLSGFEEPEIFTEVTYGCHQASISGRKLFIVGCDKGTGGDVWATSRNLGPDNAWFSPSVWSQPVPVSDDNLKIEGIELVATDDDLIHAFFTQHRDPAIYYTYWNGELWSNITQVVKLPDGEAAGPKIAAGPGNELFLIAPNNQGALYFSRATSGNAAAQSRWSSPTRIATGHDGEIGSIDIAWGAAGTVYMAYSVPVNEERGIYLVQSKDNGANWAEPLQVFDGAKAGFDLVGAPSLLIPENGSLHIIWRQHSIQGDDIPQPLSLYYARSEDGGRTFSNAELVIEEPVTWREIVADHNGNLHLFWQDAMTTVWDQVSQDGGYSWQFPQGLPDGGVTAAITVDSSDRLHLLNAGRGSLSHWLWDGSRWQPEEPLHWFLPAQSESPVDLLTAAINKQGEMVVVLAVPQDPGSTQEKLLLYSTRTLKLPAGQTAVENVPTMTLLPAETAQPTHTPEGLSTPGSVPDSEPADSQDQDQTDRAGSGGRISPLTWALVPVALLLLSVLGIVIRRAARGSDR